MNNQWNETKLPDLSGKVILITGANSGLGFQGSKVFASKGASVVMACRNMDKGKAALEEIQKEQPKAQLALLPLDLSDLDSVKFFADRFKKQYKQLDVLCNNAGVMFLPFRKTKQGFEMQFGTNHLGHFALTGLLLERLLSTDNSRIVTTSSMYHRSGKMDFVNLNGEKKYDKYKAYAASKLANLFFAYELQRKLKAASSSTISVACHPGFTATNLQLAGPIMEGSAFKTSVMKVFNRLMAQDVQMGTLPMLYAATEKDVQGGDYIGPSGFKEIRGYPTKVKSIPISYDEAIASKLWEVSQQWTGISYPL